jgi:hypothetical protein
MIAIIGGWRISSKFLTAAEKDYRELLEAVLEESNNLRKKELFPPVAELWHNFLDELEIEIEKMAHLLETDFYRAQNIGEKLEILDKAKKRLIMVSVIQQEMATMSTKEKKVKRWFEIFRVFLKEESERS